MQTTRTRTDSQKWRPHEGLSAGRGGMVENVQRIGSINGRYKIGGGRGLRIV